MSDFDHKIDQASGKVKETAGKVSGDKDLEAEGKVQKNEGKVKETLDDAGEKVRDAAGDVKAEAEALRGKFRSCSEGLALAKGLREVAVVNVGRKLASEVPPALKDELEKTAEGRLTPPERSDLGFEMYAICSKIAVTGEAAVAAGLDAEALDKRGEETSKKLTQELRQKANIIYR